MDDDHSIRSENTIAGRDLDDFLVDPNFKGAFVGGPPLMTIDQAREIIKNPEAVQKRALAALRRIAEEAKKESTKARIEQEEVSACAPG